jgi:uncharacterized Fe-S center protein
MRVDEAGGEPNQEVAVHKAPDDNATVYFTEQPDRLADAIKLSGVSAMAGQVVPVKLHMGEPGNPYIIRPELVRTVVSALRDAGARPYLFDTVVAYPGERSNKAGYEKVARRHGFSKETVGCDVVVGEEGVRVVESDVAFEVATELHHARFMLVLSHVKGHIQAGFGGAIKNLGMGGVTKASKRRIHHMSVPVRDAAKCTLCGLCADVCPDSAITVDSEWHIDRAACEGCGKCVSACKAGAMSFERMSLAEGLALSAKACVSGKTVIYVSSLHNISESCDCDSRPGPIVCPDIGYLVGRDMAAIDAAALDLIDAARPDVFRKCTGVDPRAQVAYAVGLGMADHYKLRRL